MRNKKLKYSDWKPRRRGKIYCSPACGGGCKRRDYDRLVRAGEVWKRKLGPGWNIRIWENIGWYGELFKGPLHFRLDSDKPAYGKLCSAYVTIPAREVAIESGKPSLLGMMKEMKKQATSQRDQLDAVIHVIDTVLKRFK